MLALDPAGDRRLHSCADLATPEQTVPEEHAGSPASAVTADAGAIQPHAMLLVLDPSGARVVGASANAADWSGLRPDASLVDTPVEALLDSDSLLRLRAALAADSLARPVSIGLVVRADGTALGFGLAHGVAGHLLLEIEAPVADEPQDAVPAAWLDPLLADGPRIRPEDQGDLVAELAAAADALRRTSGFDRVSVHRFTADGNAELLAESGLPAAPGQAEAFAVDDDPQCWNRMFGSQWIRMIADIDAEPVPVELPPALAVDPPAALASVLARGALACQERYLRAVRARSATMLALSNAGMAWGMIVCHAIDAPRRIPATRRIALVALARALSHRIAAHEAAVRRRHRDHIRGHLANPVAALGGSDEFMPVLSRHADVLMQGLSATGLAICVGATVECHGRTPPDAVVRELAQWLTGRPAVFATEKLGALFAPIAPHGESAGGLLAIRLSRISADFVMWFRPGETTPWTSDERDAAGELRRAVLDILVERSVRVSRRAMMLTRDNQALVSADQRKDAFIAMLGHELREPLAAFEYGVASIDGARLEGADPPAELFDVMRRQIRQMGALVEDIVDITRIRNNRLELRRRPLRMVDIVRDALDANAGALERAGQGIEVSCTDETMRVMADPIRMTQILTNLLTNAIRHARSPRPVELVVRRDGRHALIEVRDHGPGLSRKMQRTIFDAFTAPADDAEASRAGLGLGLWLARRLVESHAGSIEVTSEGKGRGSCFTLRLPLIDESAPAQSTEALGVDPRDEATKASRRILVVDDDADSAVALAMLMRTFGHQARKARDGATALAVLASYDADVVTIDQNLPDIDGTSLAREIRARSERPPRLLCITGEAPTEDFETGLFDAVLVKPADPQRLLALVGRTDPTTTGTR